MIPLVAYERALFASGIVISYIAVNALMAFVVDKLKLEVSSEVLNLDRKYAIKA